MRLGHPPVAAGVVVPGVIDEAAGIAILAANLDGATCPSGTASSGVSASPSPSATT